MEAPSIYLCHSVLSVEKSTPCQVYGVPASPTVSSWRHELMFLVFCIIRNTTFDAKAEAQSISDLGTGCVDGQETSERVRSNSAGLTVRADVTHKLGGNKLCVSGAFQDRFQCQTKTVCLPAVLSAELASDLKDGCLHYKIGIHEVWTKSNTKPAIGGLQLLQFPLYGLQQQILT